MASSKTASLTGTKTSKTMEVQCTLQFTVDDSMPHVVWEGSPFPFPHLLLDNFTLNIQLTQQYINILTPPDDPNRYSYRVETRKSLVITPQLEPAPAVVVFDNPWIRPLPNLPLPDPFYSAFAQVTLTNNRTLQSVSVITNHVALP
jgi:hypothetical protein